MTVQARSFQYSLLIHAILFLSVFMLSRNISTQCKTVLIDFSLACGSGGPGPPGPSLRRSSASNGEPAGMRGQRTEDRRQMTERIQKTVVPKPRVKPPQKPALETLKAKESTRLKASVPISKPEEKLAPEPVVKETTAVIPEHTKEKSSNDISALNEPTLEEPASQTTLVGAQTETYEDGGTPDKGHGLLAGAGSGSGLYGGGSAKGKYLRKHFGYIRTMIMNKLQYPPIARRKGWSGKLKISFLVDEDGSVNDIKVISGSGHTILDKNAVDAVKQIAPLPSPPVRAEIIMPITYRLE